MKKYAIGNIIITTNTDQPHGFLRDLLIDGVAHEIKDEDER